VCCVYIFCYTLPCVLFVFYYTPLSLAPSPSRSSFSFLPPSTLHIAVDGSRLDVYGHRCKLCIDPLLVFEREQTRFRNVSRRLATIHFLILLVGLIRNTTIHQKPGALRPNSECTNERGLCLYSSIHALPCCVFILLYTAVPCLYSIPHCRVLVVVCCSLCCCVLFVF